MANEKRNPSVKHCEYVQQLKHLKVNLDEIQTIIDKHTIIKQWAYIIHDKDVLTDEDKAVQENPELLGQPKEPHIHLYLNFGKSATTFSNVANWFKDAPQYVGKVKGKKADMLQYLIHANAPQKHQYLLAEVMTNMDIESEILSAEKSDIEALIRRISEGEIKEYNRFDFIDEVTLAKYNSLFRTAFKNRIDKVMRDPNRNIKVYFICGSTGAGKTSYAKELAKTIGDGSYYVSSSANDSLQDYSGQETLILDDLRDSVFEFADMLKILDNHTATSIKSRYFNKTFIGSTIIITTIQPIMDWYKFNKEDKGQLRRRISDYLEMDATTITYYHFDADNDYLPKKVGTIRNPIPDINAKRIKEQQKTDDFLERAKQLVVNAELSRDVERANLSRIELAVKKQSN